MKLFRRGKYLSRIRGFYDADDLIKMISGGRHRRLLLMLCGIMLYGCTLEEVPEPCTDEEYGLPGECEKIPQESYACGENLINCQTKGQDKHVWKATCVDKYNGICGVEECLPGHHKLPSENLEDGFNEFCEADSPTACGLKNGKPVNCYEDNQGIAVAECIQSSCKTIECAPDYHFLEDSETCVPDLVLCDGVNCSDWKIDNADIPEASFVGCVENQCQVVKCAETIAEKYYLFDSTRKQCYEDKCPDDPTKDNPGLCGCGAIEDVEDDDYDGVINCLDPCPQNPTKSDDTWWNETKTEGIRCEIRDTDRDGTDDSNDSCPTREGLTSKGSDCGITTTGSDGIPEFHIYNAKDLDELRTKLTHIYNNLTCSGNSDSCSGRKRKTCINGILLNYSCYTCTESNGTVTCTDQRELEAVKLRVYLENDINLDDDTETFFTSSIHNESSNSENTKTGYSMWKQIPYMVAVDFNGNGHAIRYYRNDESHRCNLLQSLFGEIILSDIHDLEIDFDMKGYGQALFAQSIVSTQLSAIKISGTVVSAYVGSDGVGLLSGSIDEKQERPVTIENITIENGSVFAPDTDNAGGLTGIIHPSTTISNENFNIQNIKANLNTIEGRNNVGGLIGSAEKGTYSGIEIQTNNIIGHDYVGGCFGYIPKAAIVFSPQGMTSVHNEKISGNNHVGGFIGYAYDINTLDVSVENETIIGNGDRIGGLIGDMSAGGFNNVSVKSKSVSGGNYVGGAFGYAIIKTPGLIKNAVGIVSGSSNIGGIAGGLGIYNLDGKDSSFDRPNYPDQTNSDEINKYWNALEDYWNNGNSGYWMYNVVETVNGGSSTGGAIGVAIHGSEEGWFGNIYNHVNKISTLDNKGEKVGGLIGTSTCIDRANFGNIWNEVGGISGYNNVGGLQGYLSGFNFRYINIFNKIGTLTSEMTAGGLIGNSDTIPANPFLGMEYIFNTIDTIKCDNSVAGFIRTPLIGSGTGHFLFKNIHSQAKQVSGYHEISAFLISWTPEKLSSTFDNISILGNVSSTENTPGAGFCNNLQVSGDSLSFNNVFSAVSIYNKELQQCTNIFSNLMDNTVDLTSLYIFFTHCRSTVTFWGNQDASNFPPNASNLSLLPENWDSQTFTLDNVENKFPVVFTEETFKKDYLPAPDENIVNELTDWLNQVSK